MASPLDSLLQQLPEGINVYDGLRGYFISQVYPSHPAFDRGAIAMVAMCGLVILMVAVSLVLRSRSTGIHWIIRDSAMTRLELRTWGPVLMAVFAICDIILTAAVLRCYRTHHWTAFVGGFQFLTLTPLLVLAQILLTNIIAQTPRIRSYLLKAGSINHRGPVGVIILASLLVFLGFSAIASILPASILLAKYTAKQTTDLNVILATIDAAQAANNQALLADLASQLQELAHTGDRCKHAIQIGGSTFAAWCAIWVFAGAVPYVLLDRAVRKKIARLERSLQEEDSRVASAHLELPQKVKLPQQLPAYGIEKPFSNLVSVPTSAMPDKYAIVIDSQLVETADKIQRLRALLRQDAILHLCYLCMIGVYSAEAVFQAAGAVDAVASPTILPLLHSFNAAAFLFTGLPTVSIYLWESIRIYRTPEPSHSRRRTAVDLSDLTTFAIPLHLGNDKTRTIERTTGIQVSQMHQVVVEQGGNDSADDDKDMFKYGSLQ